jgi:hypothetical protein
VEEGELSAVEGFMVEMDEATEVGHGGLELDTSVHGSPTRVILFVVLLSPTWLAALEAL